MKITINHSADISTVLCPRDAPLSWLAQGLEGAILWWLARESWDIVITLFAEGPMNTITLRVNPAHPAKTSAPIWSNYAKIGTLMEAKAYPNRLTNPWRADHTPQNETVLQFVNNDRNSSLGMLAYGFSDTALHMYLLGASVVRLKFSQELIQAWTNVCMNEAQVKELMDEKTWSYHPTDLVRKIPHPDEKGQS